MEALIKELEEENYKLKHSVYIPKKNDNIDTALLSSLTQDQRRNR